MNGKRVRWINKLVISVDPNLYMMFLKEYGEDVHNMKPRRAQRIAKRWWKEKKPGVEEWGKPNTEASQFVQGVLARRKAQLMKEQQEQQQKNEG